MDFEFQTATIDLGFHGIITDLPNGQIPVGAVVDAKNITMIEGFMQKSPGSRRINPDNALDGTIVNFHDWWPDEIRQRTIAATNTGKIYRDTGDHTFTLAVPIKTGLIGLTPDMKFEQGGSEVPGRKKKLFLFSASNQVQVLEDDGVTFTDIDQPAADWATGSNFPISGNVHRNHLFVFHKTTAYASDTGDHENHVTNNLILPVGPGVGGDIVASWVFKTRLFCAKENGFIYQLNEVESDSTKWFFEKFSASAGVSAPNAITQVGNDMIFGNESNSLTSLVATDAFCDTEQADLMNAMKNKTYMRKHFHVSGKKFQHGIEYAHKELAFFTNKSRAGANNDRIIVIDLNGSGPRMIVETKDSPQCLGLIRDLNDVERPHYGDELGFLYAMDEETRVVHTSAYTGEFTIPSIDLRHLDPRLAGLSKEWKYIFVEYAPEGGWNLSCDISIDGEFKETVTFPMNKDGNSELGQLKLGPTGKGKTSHNTNQTSIVRPLHGSGKRIGLRFFQAGSSQSFRVAKFTLGFEITNENPVRLKE